MKNRLWNRLRALFGGYFWLPCPNCGKDFGGHESAGVGTPSGHTVCMDCGDEVRKYWSDLSKIRWEHYEKTGEWLGDALPGYDPNNPVGVRQ